MGNSPKESIRAKAREIGFDAVGFAAAATTDARKAALRDYLGEDRHGGMAWMAETEARRADPRVLWPEAKSVVVLGLNYGPARDPMDLIARPERANVSVYARNRDYHDVVKSKLKALARWMAESFDADVKVFVDTAPVMEKPLAQAAGLGWQGKHTNLLSREWGNWLFLGEVFTTLDLPPDDAEAENCGSCRACLDVCPTDAFPAPFELDARRCISYLTIEHKGHIPADLRPGIGNRIYGCDDCLAVCPWNKFARQTAQYAFVPRVELTAPRLADLAGLDDAGFRQVFAGSPIKRIGRDRFVRNVLIAIGNSGLPDLARHAERLLGDTSPLVRAMAVWALGRLLNAETLAALHAKHAGRETDVDVRAEWGV